MSANSLDHLADRYAQRTAGLAASEVRALFAVANRPEVISLAGGMPYTSALPLDAVGEMMGELVSRRGASALQYGIGQGDERLRARICDVMALEGVVASPDDVVVTVGSQQALDIISRVFLDPGDVVLAEGPTYVGALGTFAAAQAEVVHVAMDDQGLVPEALSDTLVALRAAGRRPKFLYTIPNFHNPAGVTLPADRRERVLELAQQHDLLVVEDNPYGLLGFDGDPLPALAAHDRDRVIYLGSFSKTFSPGMRVGWVAAPHPVREKIVLISESQVLCPPTFNQIVVAEYLETQPWLEQVKVFRELYRQRRDAMLDALDSLMPPGCTWTRPNGGFYVWLTLPEGLDAKVMQPRAVHRLVAYVPGIGFYGDGGGTGQMRLSYCFCEPERIGEGVRRLAGVVEEEMELRRTFIPEASGGVPGPDA